MMNRLKPLASESRAQLAILGVVLLPLPIYWYFFARGIYWPVFVPMVVAPAALTLGLRQISEHRPWWLAIPETVLAVFLTYVLAAQVRGWWGFVGLPIGFGIQALSGSRAWGPLSLVRDLVCLRCLELTIAWSPDWGLFGASDLVRLAGRQAIVAAIVLSLNGDRLRTVARGLELLRDWALDTAGVLQN